VHFTQIQDDDEGQKFDEILSHLLEARYERSEVAVETQKREDAWHEEESFQSKYIIREIYRGSGGCGQAYNSWTVSESAITRGEEYILITQKIMPTTTILISHVHLALLAFADTP
jgi:hypothetical protein